MQDLHTWSVTAMRSEPGLEWLEDRKEDWTPLLASKLKFLHDGFAFIVICDDERSWFSEYIIKKINSSTTSRPLLPFFSLRSLYRGGVNSLEDALLLNDMLSLAFANGFIYFYIGNGNHPLAKIAKSHEDSYLWLIDERLQNSFYMSESDPSLDLKLIQLFKILDKSIDAVLFDEVVL